MGEIIYKKQFHREPIDETEPEVVSPSRQNRQEKG